MARFRVKSFLYVRQSKGTTIYVPTDVSKKDSAKSLEEQNKREKKITKQETMEIKEDNNSAKEVAGKQ